jgi:hypothetical protein
MAKTREEWLEYFSKIHHETNLDVVDAFSITTKMNRGSVQLKHREVLPTFFTGDILSDNQERIVIISLNPAFGPGTIDEQGLNSLSGNIQRVKYDSWFDTCLRRFKLYQERGEDVHPAFYFPYKMIAPEGPRCNKRNDREMIEYLQKNVVNIDWCPYYSSKIGAINPQTIRNDRVRTLVDSWNQHINDLISFLNPSLIFVHGTSMAAWFENYVFQRSIELQNLQAGQYKAQLKTGVLKNSSIPVLYLTHFATRVNSTEVAIQINTVVNRVLKR